MHVPTATVPTRAALLLRAVIVAAVGFALRRLVFNESDNAYIAPWTASTLLVPLAVPFLVAAAIPAGVARRVVARVAVALVWGVGGLCAALFVFYAVLIVGSVLLALITGSTRPDGYGVMIAHLGGAILLVPLVLLVNRRLFPPPGAHPG